MLDRTNGELIESLGRGHVVVPLSKWADTPMWGEACDRARAAFMKAGALLPIHFDADSVQVQEYHEQGRLAFIFARRVAGQWKYVPVVIAIAGQTLESLRLAGRWPAHGLSHRVN